ncbi:YjjG family noncanonical pyrimidine nucleotidase [Streptococcus cameli]
MYYKFLLFDLDHTLLDFASDEEVALTCLLQEAGVSESEIQTYKDYYVPMNKAMWEALTAGQLTKPELIRTRFAKLFEHFGQQVDGALYAERYQHFLSQQGQVFEGVLPFMEELKAQGYRLLAATNGVTFIQKGRLANSGIEHLFEHIFISDEMGYHKPDKEFYDVIAQTVPGFDAGTALMIGDNLNADIQGGINAGMDTVWFNPENKTNSTSIVPTVEIRDYESLIVFLQDQS